MSPDRNIREHTTYDVEGMFPLTNSGVFVLDDLGNGASMALHRVVPHSLGQHFGLLVGWQLIEAHLAACRGAGKTLQLKGIALVYHLSPRIMSVVEAQAGHEIIFKSR